MPSFKGPEVFDVFVVDGQQLIEWWNTVKELKS